MMQRPHQYWTWLSSIIPVVRFVSRLQERSDHRGKVFSLSPASRAKEHRRPGFRLERLAPVCSQGYPRIYDSCADDDVNSCSIKDLRELNRVQPHWTTFWRPIFLRFFQLFFAELTGFDSLEYDVLRRDIRGAGVSNIRD